MAPPGAALAAGLLFFPGLFALARAGLRRLGGCREPHAAILAARLVSSVQAVLASGAGLLIASSCRHVIDDTHWLAGAYPPFAVPYFVYDVYAMFLCHRGRGRVKDHQDAPPPPLRAAAAAFLRKDLLMVLHHAAMVLVCFPVATLWRQGKGDFFLGCLLMAELSTPFVCLGKVLILVSQSPRHGWGWPRVPNPTGHQALGRREDILGGRGSLSPCCAHNDVGCPWGPHSWVRGRRSEVSMGPSAPGEMLGAHGSSIPVSPGEPLRCPWVPQALGSP
ncbi:LOW QUALITY PROTEIN: ceramide synthase-like [Opisthocomus hoazin]|uniref:LOW QUALITY PROTEIN: ceramide synthase-like n=1 Tax=Opisthocomus hoazin TaxID=30419 RepID=UPI003F53DFDE